LDFHRISIHQSICSICHPLRSLPGQKNSTLFSLYVFIAVPRFFTGILRYSFSPFATVVWFFFKLFHGYIIWKIKNYYLNAIPVSFSRFFLRISYLCFADGFTSNINWICSSVSIDSDFLCFMVLWRSCSSHKRISWLLWSLL